MERYIITSNKSKKIAFVLCLFGGLIGLHHFYVGNILKGILYLFTLGLFGVGFIIDLVSIITGNFKDSSGTRLKI